MRNNDSMESVCLNVVEKLLGSEHWLKPFPYQQISAERGAGRASPAGEVLRSRAGRIVLVDVDQNFQEFWAPSSLKIPCQPMSTQKIKQM